ncbi:MAG: methyl-accepting chemotaxis protein [SAR324 cluster bacterium]|nr:methyl-accepting chemotaxis protein [SAR324 cluster bacterium]
MKLFNFEKINTKLIFGFLLVILLTGVLSVISLVNMQKLSSLTTKLYKHPMAVSVAVAELNGNIIAMHRSMKDVALAQNPEQIASAVAQVNAYEKEAFLQFSIIEDRFLGDKAMVATALNHFRDWKPVRDEVITLMAAGEREQAAAITKKKGAQHVAQLNTNIKVLKDFATNKGQAFFANSQAIEAKTKTETLILISLVILVGALTAFLIIRSISTLLNGLILNLSGSAEELTAASANISNSSQQLSQGALEQASSMEETSASMEEVASQAKSNAQSSAEAAHMVDEMNILVSTAQAKATSSNSLAKEAKSAAESGMTSIQKISQAMQEINVTSGKVTDIVEVINEITHQTKMLATNAAIEAARAGEQGKGFAVVADEVSKLAENSKSSAKEISSLIKEAAAKAQSGVALAEEGRVSMEGIQKKATEVVGLIDEVNQTSLEQVGKIAQISSLVGEINNASQEQSLGVEQISVAIVEMDEVTQHNASNAEESAASSEELNAQAESLRSLVAEVSRITGTELAPAAPRRSGYTKVSKLEHAPVKGKVGKLKSPSLEIPMRAEFSGF